MNCYVRGEAHCDAQNITSRGLTGYKLKLEGGRLLECFWRDGRTRRKRAYKDV